MKKSERIINHIVLILGLCMIAYYFALGLAVRFGQSLQFLWLAVGLVCVARWFYWKWVEKSGKRPPKGITRFVQVCIGICLAVFLVLESVILFSGMGTATQGLDYIVVLGAKVNGTQPSGALRNRIQVAREYLDANPEAMAVLSGGQGPDEEISEAQCMWNELTAAGIDPARLIMEDQSTDTSENLIYSRALIPEGAQVGLVTNNFHIFRALALARGLDWQVSGIPVATSLFSYPHYLMREFVGVVYDGIRGNLAF